MNALTQAHLDIHRNHLLAQAQRRQVRAGLRVTRRSRKAGEPYGAHLLRRLLELAHLRRPAPVGA